MATIVLGSQWGDEGKGKIVDVLSEDIQLCCRAQGGHNAGHTIVKGGTTFDVHILPSGVLTEGCVSLIGSGCVVYVPGFFKELNMLETHGIAPTYSTKATRSGVRVADIFNKQYFDEKVRHLADGFKKRYGDLLSYDVEDELKRFDDYRERLKPFVVDQVPLIESAVKGNVRMLV
ncbi:Adenylosuccinate, partial [Hortaea werneckii]